MLSHRSMRLPALPVNDLPRALAHQMPPGAAPVPDSWQAADDSGEWQERMQLLTGLSSGPSKGWDVEAAGRGSPPVSRSWGLETQSLRVAVTDLEVGLVCAGCLATPCQGAGRVPAARRPRPAPAPCPIPPITKLYQITLPPHPHYTVCV